MIKKIFLFGLSIFVFVHAFSKEKTPVRAGIKIYEAGKINQCPVYQFVFDNQQDNEFQIILKDQYGTVLYDEYVSGKHIVRNYLLDLSDLGQTKVYAEIFDRYGMRIQRFQMQHE